MEHETIRSNFFRITDSEIFNFRVKIIVVLIHMGSGVVLFKVYKLWGNLDLFDPHGILHTFKFNRSGPWRETIKLREEERLLSCRWRTQKTAPTRQARSAQYDFIWVTLNYFPFIIQGCPIQKHLRLLTCLNWVGSGVSKVNYNFCGTTTTESVCTVCIHTHLVVFT